MSIKEQSPEELLGLDKFNVDEGVPHIVIDKSICALCTVKPCLVACPAVLYKLKGGEMSFDYAGCLECGTCRLVCHSRGNKGIVKWQYPRGTFGIGYRHG